MQTQEAAVTSETFTLAKQDEITSTKLIPIDKIDRDETLNLRRYGVQKTTITDLAQSIATNGLQVNLRVVPNGEGRFRLKWGFRRLAAIEYANTNGLLDPPMTEVRCDISKSTDPLRDKLDNYAENDQREDFTLIDRGHFLAELQSSGMTIAQIREHIGKKRSAGWISETIKFTKFPDRFQRAIATGKVSADSATQLFPLLDEPEKLNAAIDDLLKKEGKVTQADTRKRVAKDKGEDVKLKRLFLPQVRKTFVLGSEGKIDEEDEAPEKPSKKISARMTLSALIVKMMDGKLRAATFWAKVEELF